MAAPVKQPQVTREQALWISGFLKPYDIVVASVIGLSYVTLFFWWLFGAPDLLKVVAAMIGSLVATQAWIISLVYRCMWFVLITYSEMKVLPDTAAKLAVKSLSDSATRPS